MTALSDAEIMGNIGYGNDMYSPIQTYYTPLKQEIMGNNYNVKNIGGSYLINDEPYYEKTYTRYANPTSKMGQMLLDNKQTIEDYFQNQMLIKSLNNSNHSSQNSKKELKKISKKQNDLINNFKVFEKLQNITKENLQNLKNSYNQNNKMNMILLLVFIFVAIVAYIQHYHINKLNRKIDNIKYKLQNKI